MYKRFGHERIGISRSAAAEQPTLIMKLFVVVALALVAAVAAAPVDEPIKILRSDTDQQPDGSYHFVFESENGISRDETGELKTITDEENKPHEVVVVRGSYKYTDPEGNPILVTYVADENGYRAEGDSIPKPARR